MKVLVCGGRGFADRGRVFAALDDLRKKVCIDIIIHGSCMVKGVLSGADRWAEEWAQIREIQYIGYPAKWLRDKQAAGPIRNSRMIEDGEPDLCICFFGGRGTTDMVARCRAAGIEVVEG